MKESIISVKNITKEFSIGQTGHIMMEIFKIIILKEWVLTAGLMEESIQDNG